MESNQCKHNKTDWKDKFIPGWDDKNKKWDEKYLKKGIITKYWQVKCLECNKYIPEYSISYGNSPR